MSLMKSFGDLCAPLFAIFAVFTYTDVCYLSSLIPEDINFGLKISLILMAAAVLMWMYQCSWSSAIFWFSFSLISMVTLTRVLAETE